MPHPLLAKPLFKLLFKVFWPWFLKHAWPPLLGALGDIVRRNLSGTRQDMRASIDAGLREQASKAEARARQAQAQAQAEPDARERRHQEDLARVWREVAEQYRKENEALRRQLDSLLDKAQGDIAAQARALEPELEEGRQGARLSLGSRRVELPGLPKDDRGSGSDPKS